MDSAEDAIQLRWSATGGHATGSGRERCAATTRTTDAQQLCHATSGGTASGHCSLHVPGRSRRTTSLLRLRPEGSLRFRDDHLLYLHEELDIGVRCKLQGRNVLNEALEAFRVGVS